MKELTLETMLAVMQEIFGAGLFWLMVLLAVVITVACIYVIWRERKVEAKRLVRAELTAPVGAILAILFVQFVTNSGFGDLGGPIDIILVILIGLMGAVGVTILTYAIMGAVQTMSGSNSAKTDAS